MGKSWVAARLRPVSMYLGISLNLVFDKQTNIRRFTGASFLISSPRQDQNWDAKGESKNDDTKSAVSWGTVEETRAKSITSAQHPSLPAGVSEWRSSGGCWHKERTVWQTWVLRSAYPGRWIQGCLSFLAWVWNESGGLNLSGCHCGSRCSKYTAAVPLRLQKLWIDSKWRKREKMRGWNSLPSCDSPPLSAFERSHLFLCEEGDALLVSCCGIWCRDHCHLKGTIYQLEFGWGAKEDFKMAR